MTDSAAHSTHFPCLQPTMYQINNAFTYNATGETIPINHEGRMTTPTSAGPINTKEVINLGIQDALIKNREITD